MCSDRVGFGWSGLGLIELASMYSGDEATPLVRVEHMGTQRRVFGVAESHFAIGQYGDLDAAVAAAIAATEAAFAPRGAGEVHGRNPITLESVLLGCPPDQRL
jgi:hypothetical protein